MRNGKITWILPVLWMIPLGPTATAMAAEPGQLVVEGQGEVQVAPDMAYVTLGVNRRDGSAKKAQSEVNMALEDILKRMKRIKIPAENIQTSRLTLNPIYDRSNRGEEYPRVTGYDANYTLTLRVEDLDRLGSLIDSALEGGSNRLQGVRFDLKDDAVAKSSALRKAVESARKKANVLAAAAGVNLLSILQIQESGAALPQPRFSQVRAMRTEMAGAPTQIMPGTLTVRASVTITWAIGQ